MPASCWRRQCRSRSAAAVASSSAASVRPLQKLSKGGLQFAVKAHAGKSQRMREHAKHSFCCPGGRYSGGRQRPRGKGVKSSIRCRLSATERNGGRLRPAGGSGRPGHSGPNREARMPTGSRRLLASGAVAGTLAWRRPSQARGLSERGRENPVTAARLRRIRTVFRFSKGRSSANGQGDSGRARRLSSRAGGAVNVKKGTYLDARQPAR